MIHRLVALALVLLGVLGPATAAFAEERQTVTATVVLQVPVLNRSILGTMVLDNVGTPADFESSFIFRGQVDGHPATATGLVHATWTGNAYRAQITRIDTWDVAGLPQPRPPIPVALSTPGGQLAVAGRVRGVGEIPVPLNVKGVSTLPPPFQGNLVLSVTNAPSGAVGGLPKTGAAPGIADGLAGLLIAGGGALVVLARRRRSSRLSAGPKEG